ncbi:MAG: hypothetical protein DI533_20695 [Cereibacter sphaeroides]|uniref:Uncharacterized protein n=1 Tax=Cereibacter sphaeroides TaxID=1063 RepID=A0A2W5THD0_CERSP|nr:MAG: hypothetical protein DI533_20695 [Cereibacter sphaeroides]
MARKVDAVTAVVKAMREADAMRRVIISKGFKRPDHTLRYTRRDADLWWCADSRRWICDIWKTSDGDRVALVTRKANDGLSVLLKSFM